MLSCERVEQFHLFGDDLRGHVIASRLSAPIGRTKDRLVELGATALGVLNPLAGPGVDQIQEAGEGEVERVDPGPRTRPVDF